jgi:hypothetical protein
MTLAKKAFALLVSASLVLAAVPGFAQVDPSTVPLPVQGAHASKQELQQLVAPIALYPDELAAQILAASTYPDQVVEAARWIQQHSDLKGEALAQAVDQQPWDASVKALVPFPSVLANMDKNLSWTSSLGDAYVNQQKDVMKAIQEMRKRAQKAGNLNSSSQENVTRQEDTIIIEPADPQIVYVPEYDPWLAYGDPLIAWPGWYPVPGIFYGGPAVTFGYGFGIGFFSGFGWGWHHWGFDWHHRELLFDHDRYHSHSRIFADRSHFDHGHRDFNHGSGYHPDRHEFSGQQHGFGNQHGFGAQHGQPGMHSGAFSGFGHGGDTRGFSGRGHSSFGAGGFHGGFHGGGFHGGGGHGGGGHR